MGPGLGLVAIASGCVVCPDLNYYNCTISYVIARTSGSLEN
jgi:hypothetical protein